MKVHVIDLLFILPCIMLSAGCATTKVTTSKENNYSLDQIFMEANPTPNNGKNIVEKAEAHDQNFRNWPLPNFEAGPMRPLPCNANFYMIYAQYPSYLLCIYRIKEENYRSSKEPEWFQESLRQIRKLGKKAFPPVKWIAIIIRNIDEHKSASTFEKSFKVGAIFKASDVFDLTQDISDLISHARFDHHPFVYDPQKYPDTDQQQRWVLVERHVLVDHCNR